MGRTHFIRTTLVGGLLFLGPVLVLVFMLGKAFDAAHALVGPLVAMIPVEVIAGVHVRQLLAVLALLLFCFVIGLLAQLSWAKLLVSGLESRLLTNIPGYEFFKSIGGGMLGAQTVPTQQTVFARFDDCWQLGFLMERLDNGLVVVFLPGSPSPYSGSLHYMTADRITVTDVPMQAAMQCIKRMGMGSSAAFGNLKLHEGESA